MTGMTAKELPLRRHTERVLHDYFSNLNGHRPARLYDMVLREGELRRGILCHQQRCAKGRIAASRSAAMQIAVSGQVLACHPKPRALAMERVQGFEVGKDDRSDLGAQGFRRNPAVFQLRIDSAEDPW